MGDKTFFKNIKLRVHYLTKLDAHPYNFGTLVHLFVFFLGGRRGAGGGGEGKTHTSNLLSTGFPTA